MPYATTPDNVKLYYEEVGQGRRLRYWRGSLVSAADGEIRRNLTAFLNNAGPGKGFLVLTAMVPGNGSGTNANDIRIPGAGPGYVAGDRV